MGNSYEPRHPLSDEVAGENGHGEVSVVWGGAAGDEPANEREGAKTQSKNCK